jgi:arylsulfatase A-like enzyme
LTGKYPARLDLTQYFHGTDKDKLVPAPYKRQLPLEEVTIAEALKDAGYQTFMAGKWHIGWGEYFPEHQGFDTTKGIGFGSSPRFFSPYRNPRLPDGPEGEHLPDRLASETIQFMKANRDQPFFVDFSMYSVHVPLMSRKDLMAKYEEKRQREAPDTVWGKDGDCKVRQTQNRPVYAGMVEAMDLAVGRVLDALDELGLSKNTVVIFTSDNGGLSTQKGPMPRTHGGATSNLPLRGGKAWIHEGGIRVPWIVKWPGITRPDSVCDVPITSTDVYPTLLEMAGQPLRPSQHRDGLSFVPLLKGAGTLAREAIYWHYPHYCTALGGMPAAAVRSGPYKLIEFFENDRVELYNLENDIGETKDLSEELPEKTAELRALLHEWYREVDAKMPSPNPEHKE